MKYGSVHILQRIATYSVEEILPLLGQAEIRIGGIAVRGDELRLLCFKANGVVCAGCGEIGSYFAIESVRSDSFQGLKLNLYGCNGGYFTKDHVIPTCLGGPDTLDNLQPMCWDCNSKKGSNLILKP